MTFPLIPLLVKEAVVVDFRASIYELEIPFPLIPLLVKEAVRTTRKSVNGSFGFPLIPLLVKEAVMVLPPYRHKVL